MSNFLLKIEWDSPEEKTLKIVLGENEHYADLYYFCLDNTFFEDNDSITKGLLNFVCMVENWKLKIKHLKIGASTALPFDYSDQYIAFFIISKLDEHQINIQAAFTTEEQGWGTNPSQLYLVDFAKKSYELDGEKYTMPIHQLLKEIEQSMTDIFGGFYKNYK